MYEYTEYKWATGRINHCNLDALYVQYGSYSILTCEWARIKLRSAPLIIIAWSNQRKTHRMHIHTA